MQALKFVTMPGMPQKAIESAAQVNIELIESDNQSRAARARELVSRGVAVVTSWYPILKQWKCSLAQNPMILLTCDSPNDHSYNLRRDEICAMAVAGIEYVQSTILPKPAYLRQDRFVEVRLVRSESDPRDDASEDTIHLFDVEYKRKKRTIALDAPAPYWVQDRAKRKPDSELKWDLLHPRNIRKNLAHYVVLSNGRLQKVA